MPGFNDRVASGALAVSLALSIGAAAASTGATPTPGWSPPKQTDLGSGISNCTTTLSPKGRAGSELSVIAEGPLLLLTVNSPAFGDASRQEPISLKAPGLDPLQRRAIVADETYGVTIDNEVDGYLLHADPLTLTLHGVDYSFPTSDVSAAIDAVRRCAGQPAKAAKQAKKSVAVPDGWKLAEAGDHCTARLQGQDIDTIVSLNDSNQVVLVVSRNDWNAPGKNVDLTLQFDSLPPRPFTAWALDKLVLLSLIDRKDVDALRTSSTLRWHLPTGDYVANVHGIGAALDAATACTRKKRGRAAR